MTPRNASQQNQVQPAQQPAAASALPIAAWGATDKGREREGNEDAIYPHSGSDTFPFEPNPRSLALKGQLLIVADGVGGAKAGREASHWAIRVAVERYYDLAGPDLGADLRTAIEVANASLYQYLQSTGTREAGCTMVAAVIQGDTLHVANVGDSRAYIVRNGQIAQLTRDHTVTQHKIDQGLIRPEQAELDPSRNVLTRSLGSGPTVQADLFPPLQLTQGDTLLLCSDGLTDMVDDAEITRLVNDASPKRAAQRLIAAANRNGGFDNISVVIARAGGKQTAAGGGLLDRIRQMTRRQKVTLLVGGVLVAAALCAMASLGWWMYGRQRDKPTPTATTMATVAPAITPTEPALTSPAAQPTETEQATDEAPTSQPTSTPAPTITPTYTPPPPPPTDTPSPTPSPAPTATEGGGDDGGGGGDDDGGSKPKKTPVR